MFKNVRKSVLFYKKIYVTAISLPLFAALDHKDLVPAQLAIQVQQEPAVKKLLDVVTNTKPVQQLILGYLTWEGNSIPIIDEKSPSITCLQFSPCKKYMVTGSATGMIGIWDAKTFDLIKSCVTRKEVSSITFSQDGKKLLATARNGVLGVWNLATGELLQAKAIGFAHIRAMPDGRYIAFHKDGSARVAILDPVDFSRKWEGDLHQGVDNLAFSSDGKYLRTWAIDTRVLDREVPDHSIKIWDAKTLTCVNTRDMHELFEVTAVAWSPDDIHCATSDMSNTMRILDAQTFKHIKSSTDHVLFGNSLCYSPCGQLLLHGSFHNNISVWDSSSLKLLQTFKHIRTFITEGHVQHVAFSPCGNYLISAGTGLKIWPKQSVEIDTADADKIQAPKPDTCKKITAALSTCAIL